ncbi:TetR/AcrR family transcriptional regulator [Streptomyces sp. NPDC002588]|uniref:TetR/AcrR family transcriptional regulator n=1 Tax=Streptomyces sp. NPDC002588 TaxID=3154419 RepID=UPI003326B0BA
MTKSARATKASPASDGPSVPGRGTKGNSAGRPSSRRELVENEMFEHASRLFAERGFAGTTLGDIAEAMGITRPALYYYVKSKDELLAKLVEEITEGPAAEIEALAADTDADPADRLHRIAHLMALQPARLPKRFQLLLRSEADLPPAVAQSQRAAQRSTLRHLIGVIDEGVLKGQFRPVEARTAALAVAGMCNWVAWWYHPGGKHGLSADETADQIAGLAVAMVRQTALRTPEAAGPTAALALLRQDLDYLERTLDEQARDDRG